MHALIDFIRGNIEREGENQGMIAALRANSAGYNPAAGAQAAPGPTAQDAPDTSGNPSGEGQNIGDMIQAYSKNKAINSAAQADTEDKLTQLGQSGRLGNVLDTLPDDGKKLLEKYQKNGGGSITDSIKLNGMLNAAMRTSSDLQKQQIEGSRARIEQIQAAQQGVKFNMQMDAVKRLLDQKDVSNDPMAALSKQFLENTGSLPSPEVMAKFQDMLGSVEMPIGYVPRGQELAQDGKGSVNLYQQVIKNGRGSIRTGDTVKLPEGSKLPGRMLDPDTLSPTGEGAHGEAPGPSATLVKNSPEQQKAIEDAAGEYSDLQKTGALMDQLGGAIQEYTKGDPQGGRFNSFLGSDKGRAFSQAMGNPAATNLEALSSQAALGLMSGSKIGNRFNQQEVEMMREIAPKATDPNDTLLKKAAAGKAMYNIAAKRQSDYINNLQAGIKPAAAKTKAMAANPLPNMADFWKSKSSDTGESSITPSNVGGPIPTVSSAEDYAGLPRGAMFRTPSGKTRIKQ